MGTPSTAKPIHTWMWKESTFSDALECSVALYPDRLIWYRSRYASDLARPEGPPLSHRGGDARAQSRPSFLKEGPPDPAPRAILEEILERLGADPALATRWSLA